MTTKTIRGVYTNGYVLKPQYNVVAITQTGTIDGTLLLQHVATVVNGGLLDGNNTSNGVTATAAALISNATTGIIEGYSGIFTQNARATVDNFGYVGGRARYGDGVFLTAGGYVRNEDSGYIYGDNSAISLGAISSVVNFGGIYGFHGQGVDLAAGGSVVNGSRSNTGAYINSTDSEGVMIGGGVGIITNYGEIENLGGRAGVYLAAGGTVTNAGGLINVRGPNSVGVYAKGAATQVLNGGEIVSVNYSGVVLRDGGTVANIGTIYGGQVYEGAYFGILISGASGSVTNGSPTAPEGIIRGSVYLDTTGSASNFATVVSKTGTGVYVKAGSVTNGSAAQPGALIEGYYVGVRVGADTTVTNFGTIEGEGGFAPKAIEMSASDTLVVEAGCAFEGQVLGGGGTLDLSGNVSGGTGQLSLAASGTVTALGSAATTFSDFGVVEIAKGASFAAAGAVTVSAGESLIVSGVLTLGARTAAVDNEGLIETLGGTLTVVGAVTGAGSASISAGLLDFASTFSQNVTLLGPAGTLELAKSRTYGGTIAGFLKSGGSTLDLADIGFVGAGEATFKGNKSGGTLTVSDGTHTAKIKLTGDYRTVTFIASSDGHGGSTIVGSGMDVPKNPSPNAFIAAMAGLGPAGPSHVSLREAWTSREAPLTLTRTEMA